MPKKKVKCANCGKEFEIEYIDDDEYISDYETCTWLCSARCFNEY